MYKYHSTSRTFLLGLDNKDYSQTALEWGMEELFEDNDELVILRVIDTGISLVRFLDVPIFDGVRRRGHANACGR